MNENDRLINDDADEVDEVLAALGWLKDQVSNPVIRACLDDTIGDIVHLVDKNADRAGAVDAANSADQSEAA